MMRAKLSLGNLEWCISGGVGMHHNQELHPKSLASTVTLPETNSSPLKISHPNRKGSYSNHPFSGAMLVSGRVVFGDGAGKQGAS